MEESRSGALEKKKRNGQGGKGGAPSELVYDIKEEKEKEVASRNAKGGKSLNDHKLGEKGRYRKQRAWGGVNGEETKKESRNTSHSKSV